MIKQPVRVEGCEAGLLRSGPMQATFKVTAIKAAGEGVVVSLDVHGSLQLKTKLEDCKFKIGDTIEVQLSKENRAKLSKGQKVPGRFMRLVEAAADNSCSATACKKKTPRPRGTDF